MTELELIEKSIQKYFPEKIHNNKTFFYDDPSYKNLDKNALQSNLNSPIRDFVLTGGKRIRPILFFKALRAFNVDYKKYTDIAALIELVHNATLILDDIEDKAATRRGKPTTALTFGLDTAVNSGMALHILPLKIIENYKGKLPDSAVLHLWEIYTDELSNLSLGQAIDIYWHKHRKNNITILKYMQMVELKTGSLFRVAIRFACAIAQLSKDVESDFATFAGNIGVGFQIEDDVLDLKNDRNKLGKSLGNDITEGKMSLPVLIALKEINRDEAVRLRAILSRHTRNKELIAEALRIINSSQAINKAQAKAQNIILNSIKTLNSKYENQFNLKELYGLAEFLINRDH